MAPQMGRPSVVSLWLSPAPDTSQTSCLWVSGMFRHIIFTRGRTAPPSRGSPRARHFTDLLSVGVGIVPPHHFHEREDRASLSWLSPRPTLHRPPVCGCRDCSATSVWRYLVSPWDKIGWSYWIEHPNLPK